MVSLFVAAFACRDDVEHLGFSSRERVERLKPTLLAEACYSDEYFRAHQCDNGVEYPLTGAHTILYQFLASVCLRARGCLLIELYSCTTLCIVMGGCAESSQRLPESFIYLPLYIGVLSSHVTRTVHGVD